MLTRLKSLPETANVAVVSTRKEDLHRKASNNLMLSTPPSLPVSIPAPTCARRNLQQDLADLLSCPVCLEEYQAEGTGEREPLFLTCHHSLCRTCLPKLTRLHQGKYAAHANMGEVPCPECRVVTLVPPSGLTQNFYLVSLIEAKRKKPREASSRLRMWCGECDAVALESCATHHLTHLSSVLSSAVGAYGETKSRLTSLLQVRARRKEEEVRRVKEAVEHLDRASLCLRRRLVANLDQAALVQVTANSLLHEVEEMTRKVESGGKTAGKPALYLPDGAGGGKRDKRSSTHPSSSSSYSSSSSSSSSSGSRKTSPPAAAGGLRKTRSDLSDLVASSGAEFEGPPLRRPAPAPSSGGSSSSHLNSPDPAYDHLSCQEQEAKITLLRQCLVSLEAMEASLEAEGGGAAKKGGEAEDYFSREELMEAFKRAVEAAEGGGGDNARERREGEEGDEEEREVEDGVEEDGEVWMKMEQEDNARKY